MNALLVFTVATYKRIVRTHQATTDVCAWLDILEMAFSVWILMSVKQEMVAATLMQFALIQMGGEHASVRVVSLEMAFNALMIMNALGQASATGMLAAPISLVHIYAHVILDIKAMVTIFAWTLMSVQKFQECALPLLVSVAARIFQEATSAFAAMATRAMGKNVRTLMNVQTVSVVGFLTV